MFLLKIARVYYVDILLIAECILFYFWKLTLVQGWEFFFVSLISSHHFFFAFYNIMRVYS
jgi:hypothetical protein